MQAFWAAFIVSLTAEIGDKSQLLILGYATRFTLRQVILGVLLGTVAVMFIPAVVGGWVGQRIPPAWVHGLSAALFLFFGFWTLREDGEEEKMQARLPYPVLTIAATLFLVEFGDKTMLATAALASTMSWLPVWLGAAAGMALADIGTVFVGRVLHKTIPEKQIRWLAAALFFAFAAWSAIKAFRAWGAL